MQRRRRYFGGHHRVRANPPKSWKKTTLHWLEDHPYRHHTWMRKFVGRLEQATDDATIMKLKKQLQTWLEGVAADESAAAGDSPSAADINRALLMGTLGIGESGVAVAATPGTIAQPGRIGHGVRRRRVEPPAPRTWEPTQDEMIPLPGIAATHALFMLQIWGAIEDAVAAVRRHGLLVDTLEDPYESDINITRLYAWGENENVVREWRDDSLTRQGTGDLYYYRVLDDDTARIHGSSYELDRRVDVIGGLLAPGGGQEEPHRVGPRGTVISGTFRPRDLIPAFYAELMRVAPARQGRIENEMEAWRVESEAGETDPEEDEQLVQLIADELNAVAPHGVYFGAHPGAGSDFGWWENEEDEETPSPRRIRGLTTETPAIDYDDYDEHSVGDEENTASWQVGVRPGHPRQYFVRVWFQDGSQAVRGSDAPYVTDVITEAGPFNTEEEASRAGRDVAVGWCIDNDVNYEDEPPVRCAQCGVDVDNGAINVGNLPFCSRDCVTEYQRETPEWEARDAQARHDLPTADENLERLEQRVINREAQRVREETGTRPGGSFAYRLFIRGNRAQAVNAAELRGFTVIESRTLPSDDRDRYRTGVDAWTLDGDATDDWYDRTRRSQDRPGSLLDAEELSAAIAGEPPTEITYDDLDHFTQAYIAAALWSTNDESTPAGGVPLDQNYGPHDIAPDTLRQMLADCVRFRAENAADLRELDNTEQAGHDFWLTREGHGVGFWDRDLGELGERLSEAARRFGEFSLTIGDDGMIHH